MGEEQQQAPAAAPQTEAQALEAALAKVVEVETQREEDFHAAKCREIQAKYDALAEEAAAEDARRREALAGLRARAVAKLLAAATGAALPMEPEAPKASRAVRPKKEREVDAAAIVAALTTSEEGMGAADIAKASGVEIDVVRSSLPGLVRAGRIFQNGKGRGVTYSLPPAVPASAGGVA